MCTIGSFERYLSKFNNIITFDPVYNMNKMLGLPGLYKPS